MSMYIFDPADEERLVQLAKEMREAVAFERVRSRNAPCSCGSGKKYKKCCGAVRADGLPVYFDQLDREYPVEQAIEERPEEVFPGVCS